MKNYIKGYKSFNEGLVTTNNVKFEVGVPMHVDGEIRANPINGNGFHMCLNFEDTFRYIENPILCEVTGYGTISDEFSDEYNGYYDIYACSDMVIDRIIPREEVIEMAKDLPEYGLRRFISTYKMTEEEIKELSTINLSEEAKGYIDYFQNNNKEAFKLKNN